MKKILIFSSLLLVTSSAFALNPGDVSFANYYSGSSNHAVKYALKFTNGAQTIYTGCLSPNGQFDPAGVLTKAAMGSNSGTVSIVAQDCVDNKIYQMNATSNFNYQPEYYYQYGCQINGNGGNYCIPG